MSGWLRNLVRRRGFAVAVCAVMLLGAAVAWTQTAGVSFEAATVKPSEPLNPALLASGQLRIGMFVTDARVDLGYLSLANLIPIAFGVKGYQLSGPDWMGEQRFDIAAKLPEGATKEQVPDMLRALLEERFRLKAHHETRDFPVYALVAGKEGPKLKQAAPDPPASGETGGPNEASRPRPQFQIQPGAGGAVISAQGGVTKISMTPDGQMRFEVSKLSMPAFADMLTQMVGRPVLDMTGLKGNYQVALDISRDTLFTMAAAAGIGFPLPGGLPGRPADASDPSGGSIFTSVQQMGLRLEARNAPLDFVVVDQVEKMPSDN